MNYRLTNSEDCIEGIMEDGTIIFIPNNPQNRDWKDYLIWQSMGNAPLPTRF